MELLHAITALISTFSGRMSRAARKLSLRRRPALALSARVRNKHQPPPGEIVDGEVDDGLWRRAILMGEKCQPLDFSGVIYYDADGRRLAEAPPPRSPLRSSLPPSALKEPVAADYID